MYISLVGLTWEMEHASDTLQSSLRFSHQIAQPLPPLLGSLPERRSVCTFCATEDLGYFPCFPRCLESSGFKCMCVGWLHI